MNPLYTVWKSKVTVTLYLTKCPEWIAKPRERHFKLQVCRTGMFLWPISKLDFSRYSRWSSCNVLKQVNSNTRHELLATNASMKSICVKQLNTRCTEKLKSYYLEQPVGLTQHRVFTNKKNRHRRQIRRNIRKWNNDVITDGEQSIIRLTTVAHKCRMEPKKPHHLFYELDWAVYCIQNVKDQRQKEQVHVGKFILFGNSGYS